MEGGGSGGGGVELELVVAAVFGELEAGEGGAEEDFEGSPGFGLGEGGGHALDGVTEEFDFGEAAEDSTLGEDDGAVEMADDGALDLMGAGSD